MSPELIKVLLRHLLSAVGGGATAFSDNDLTQLAGGVMVAITIGMSIYDKRKREEEKAPEIPPSRPVSKYGKRDR